MHAGERKAMVRIRKPNVYVTDLNSEGVLVTANFWLDTNESRPIAVYDRAAVSGDDGRCSTDGFELFPPGSMIVQQPGTSQSGEPGENKKEILD